MYYTNRRSTSDQDEYNLPAGQCQTAIDSARNKQAAPSCIHSRLSDVFLFCICLYLSIVVTANEQEGWTP